MNTQRSAKTGGSGRAERYVAAHRPPVPEARTVRALRRHGADPTTQRPYVRAGGTVAGANFNAAGLDFAVVSGGYGVNVYRGRGTLGYTPAAGDSVVVTGTLTLHNGLTRLLVDTLRVVRRHGVPPPARWTDHLDADTLESTRVTLRHVRLVNPLQWSRTADPGFFVDLAGPRGLVRAYVDRQSALFGRRPPRGTFHLTGIVSQADGPPYRGGYFLLAQRIDRGRRAGRP